MHTKHCIIIGGGLAGPCLALTLAKNGIKSTIFEIRLSDSSVLISAHKTTGSEPSSSGGSISLSPQATYVLEHYAGVYEKIKAAGYQYHKFGAYTEEGEYLGDIAAGEIKDGKDGRPAIRIMRPTLHKVLLDAVAEQKALIDIKVGMRMRRIDERAEGVTVHFEDGSSIEGDLVLGCDGMHSKVREHVLGDAAPTPEFTGIALVNGFVPAHKVIAPSNFKFPAFVFSASGMIMTIPIDPQGATLAWGINLPMQDRTRAEWVEFEASGEAAREAKAEYDGVEFQPVRSLIDSAKDDEATLWAQYRIPSIPTWHSKSQYSRVVLLGDAAHASEPNGTGSMTAFEDTAVLASLLHLAQDREISHAQVFAKYESLRRPRVDALRENSKGMKAKQKTGPWLWALKKMAFRGYFWWNSYLLQHIKSSPYDLEHVKIEL